MNKLVIAFWSLLLIPTFSFAQEELFNYGEPKEYELGGIKVTGADYSDDNAIISISGLRVGDKLRIPGPEVPKAIKALWKLRLFESVEILKEKTIGDVIFLEIVVQERPRLTRHSFTGIKKSFHDDLNEEVNKHLLKGGIVTENVKVNASEGIEKYFVEKGYLDTRVTVREETDTSRINAVGLVFNVDRGNRIKIQDVTFSGNDNMGLWLKDSGSNTVGGNYIGTDAAGSSAIGNGAAKPNVLVETADNYIGGVTGTPGLAPGNVISGSEGNGLQLASASATNNYIQGNLIGTNAAGTAIQGNGV
ncbi:MAG: right-handed parallel beta-helix repeat-containing protein, partial [Saprospiraceae bacterium]|nr:right-handed parallel beta-helix repeat-containing protein [Saprospiraceae bacterium]